MTIKGTSADMTQFKKEQQELQWLCQNQSKLQQLQQAVIYSKPVALTSYEHLGVWLGSNSVMVKQQLAKLSLHITVYCMQLKILFLFVSFFSHFVVI